MMLLLFGKPFSIGEDGATTMEQLRDCEQPELLVSLALYQYIIESVCSVIC
jgi:hypothetical protein